MFMKTWESLDGSNVGFDAQVKPDVSAASSVVYLYFSKVNLVSLPNSKETFLSVEIISNHHVKRRWKGQ